MSKENVLGSAARSASYNIIVQIAVRVITFILNGVTVRYSSREMLGLVNVRLMLLASTGHFLCYEAFRLACLSYSQKCKGPTPSWAEVMNVLWLQLPLSLVVMPMLAYAWLNFLEQPDLLSPSQYTAAVSVYAVCVVLDILAEPLCITAQAFLFIRLKVVEMSVTIVLKAIVTVYLLVFSPHLGILIFCFAHAIASLSFVVIYYGYIIYYIYYVRPKETDSDGKFPLESVRDLFPRHLPSKLHQLNRDVLSLVFSFFKQGLLKQLLTEGERYVMTFLHLLSLADQGVYDVVSNLGSLSARLIFQPVEESSYLFFTHTLSRGVATGEQDGGRLTHASRVLSHLLRLVVLVGVTILVFGCNYSYLLLHVYGGDNLSSGSGPTLLRAHSLYILVIAVNGVTEAFVFALMSAAAVEKYNRKMLAFSVVFLLSTYQLTRWFGSVGLILGNCVNMLLRIGHSVCFITAYLQPTSLSPLTLALPSLPTVSCYLAALAATSTSNYLFCCPSLYLSAAHVVFGACTGLTLLAVLYQTERAMISFMHEHLWRDKEKIN